MTELIITKRINLAKSSGGKEWLVCHYWLFNHGFNFQDSVCNGCHDSLMQCIHVIDIAIITKKRGNYCSIIHDISKFDTINLLKI